MLLRLEEWLFWKLYMRFKHRASYEALCSMYEWLGFDLKCRERDWK
jgi:hypothetical protein